LHEAFAEALGGAGVSGAARALVGQRDAAVSSEIEKGLAFLVLVGEAVEQPAQQDCRQDNLLDHHHPAREVLVRQRAQPRAASVALYTG